MKNNLGCFIFLLTLVFAFISVDVMAGNKKPNILLIVADDLGYSDLGVYGGEIRTPNIDKLANQGRLLKNFYTQPTCSPTRSELFSGTDHHLAGIGSMIEELAPEQVDKAGYEGMLDDRVAALPALLKDAGYNTYMAGKWHLGGPPDHRPGARGFDRSYALLQGGASHYKQDVQRLFFETPEPKYTENDVVVQIPDDFYSSKTYTDKLIEYIDSGKESGKPFFAYAAYTAPHWPIQAPEENLQKVRGRYDAGYEAIGTARFERQKRLGIAGRNAKLPPLPEGVVSWHQLSNEEKARNIKVYEAYAAAVENLDENIGRLIQHLRDKGELENTFIIFLSDNGAEGNDPGKEGITLSPGTGQQYYDDFYKWIDVNYDNSLKNIGKKGSYVSINEAWGQVSALPNHLYKATTTEGGVRAPAFVYYPKSVKSGKTETIITVRDILPTLLDVAGTQHPGISYKGKPILPVQGVSALPYLNGKDTVVHSDTTAYGFELFGRSALRKGDWKIVRLYPPTGNGVWQLFNLQKDPAELVDVSNVKANYAKLNELKRDWRSYVEQNNVIELGYDYGYGWVDDTLLR